MLSVGQLGVPSVYLSTDKASEGVAGSLGSYMLSGYYNVFLLRVSVFHHLIPGCVSLSAE